MTKYTARVLKNLRDEKGVSMDQMAKEMKAYGVSPSKSMISMWESGKSSPTMENAKAIAEYFGTTLDNIFNEVQNLEHLDKVANKPSTEIHTIAAHATEELTDDEIEKVLEFALMLKATRGERDKARADAKYKKNK